MKTAKRFETPHESARTNGKAKATKKAKAPKSRKGKLGDVLGFSIVSVIRAMGRAGWDADTARAALSKAGVQPAEHTLKVGLRRGKNHEKFFAPLTPAQLNGLKAAKVKKAKSHVA